MINRGFNASRNFSQFPWFILLFLTNQQCTIASELQGMVTELVVYPNNMQIQLKWNASDTKDSKLDVTVTPLSGQCHQGVCIADGVSMNSRKIALPKHTVSIANTTPECSIDPGCDYHIKVETQNRHESRNITFRVPDCSQLVKMVCSCRLPFLPELSMFGNLIHDEKAINITWNLKIPNGIERLNISKMHIVMTIFNKTNPLLSWGGRLDTLSVYNFPIEVKLSSGQTLSGYKVYKITSTNSFGSHYLIEGWIVDNKGCVTHKKKFTLVDSVTKQESRTAPESLQYKIISIIVPVALLFLVVLCVYKYLHKHFKKTSNDTISWRSIYRNVPSQGTRHQISMEENFLYFDKDILDAQEKGKADIFEIPHNNITILNEIGKGAFGRVFKATVQNLNRKPGKTTVAVKQLKKKPLPSEMEEFLSEIQTMKSVGHHENVVTLLGCCTIKEPYMMIMEYVGQGDLLQYLRNIRRRHLNFLGKIPSVVQKVDDHGNNNVNNNPLLTIQGKYLELHLSLSSVSSEKSYTSSQSDVNKAAALRPSVTETMYTMISEQTDPPSNSINSLEDILDSNELHNFAIQIAKGMKHLEERGITHRDLAARNVLIDEYKTLKISDFGLSRPGIYVKPKDKAKLLPLRWLSIEAIHDNLYSSKSDVWAFGIVLWEIGTLGGFPYPTLNNQELLQFLYSGRRLDKPEICSEFLYKLMLSCWDEDPDKRPSFAGILKSLQSQNQKIYVNFNSLGPDYVFPPANEQFTINTESKT